MFKFTAIVLLLVGSCLQTESLNEIEQFDGREKFDGNQDFDEAKELDETNEFDKRYELNENQETVDEIDPEFDENQEFDEMDQEFDENQELDEMDQEFDESQESDESQEFDETVERNVRYLDTAREALLKFARELRKGKNVTNAFLKVIDGFEKNIADFQATVGRRRIDPGFVNNVKQFIGEASKNRKANTMILRTLTAQGIFLAQKNEGGSTRVKRDPLLVEGALAFLESIKEDIGEESFDEFLSISGLVTLIFVIDDTGSMGDEIDAVVAIAKNIVQRKRDFKVDYILSPFNDPTIANVTVKNETAGMEFVAALDKLKPHGGGDCPELAFKGMIDALNSSPQPGSSMYVFTDAPPKDSTPENIDEVVNTAADLEVLINFFTTHGCGTREDQAVYGTVATNTGGDVYPLSSSDEIRKLGQVVIDSLSGRTSIASGGSGSSSGRRKRALAGEYTISVDDTIEKILITVTTQNSFPEITLHGPKGKTITTGRKNLMKGVVYDIPNPVPGVYKLIVAASAGQHKYKVNAVSGTNINFGHYYAFVPKRGRARVPVPIENPLQGTPVTVFITVAGAESVTSSSLRIKVVRNDGTVHADKPLRPVGTSGVRYVALLDHPPLGKFKLELHGRTKKDNQFVRKPAREDQAVPVVLRLSYRRNSNVLPRAEPTRLRIQLRRGNVGESVETYTASVKDLSGYSKVGRPKRSVRRGRIGFITIVVTVPADAPKGKTVTIEVFITKEGETKPTATLILHFLIV